MHACCCGELEAADAFHSLEVEYECKNMRLGLLLSSFAHRDGHSAVLAGEVLKNPRGHWALLNTVFFRVRIFIARN